MTDKYYPDEHLFLLKCSAASDFNTEIKSIFEKENISYAGGIAEKIEILSNNLVVGQS